MPDGAGVWTTEVNANWKCVRDVDNEGYHVPMAHPGLHDLFGPSYYDEAIIDGANRSYATFREEDSRLWSVRAYKSIVPDVPELDAEHKRAWLYVGMFPNLVIGLYPDCAYFYQEFPLENGTCIQRGALYKHAEESREMRAARYLSGRIDRITSKEDEQLIEWCWEASFSSGFDGVILSDLELGVRSYHDALREHFPVLDYPEPPRGTLKARNDELLDERA